MKLLQIKQKCTFWKLLQKSCFAMSICIIATPLTIWGPTAHKLATHKNLIALNLVQENYLLHQGSLY